MPPEICTYRASDGARLHYRLWPAAGLTPVRRVVALHGIQSHSGWYAYSSEQLSRAGCEVCFLDRRGSGMNEADRGHVAGAGALIDDVVQFLAQAQATDRGAGRQIPQVLLAVSWGGKLATHVAARRSDLIDGLALLYPGLAARVRASAWQNAQLSLADRLHLHHKRVPIPLDDPALFAADPHAQEFIRNDPLSLREVSVSFLLANRQLDRTLPGCAPAIQCPVLLLLAGNDRIIDNAATRALVERFATTDRTLHEYAGACHTLEFEPDRDRFIGDLCAWLNGVKLTRDIR